MKRSIPESGFSLLETVFALCILLVVAAGVMPLGLLATKSTENQGHLMARTTEYAQDKLEQLLVLSYGDSTSDTRVFPTADAGGTGLSIGGSSNPAAPVAGYVDYLDINGNPLDSTGAQPAAWFYMRVWRVEVPGWAPLNATGGATLKRVTATTIVKAAALGGSGRIPQSTVAAVKTLPF